MTYPDPQPQPQRAVAQPQPQRAVAPTTCQNGRHVVLSNDRGDVVSPVKQYGVSEKPRFFCAKCKSVITEAAARATLGVPEDQEM